MKQEKCKKRAFFRSFVHFHELSRFFCELIPKRLRRKDFDGRAVGAELLDEIEGRCYMPFEDTGFGFALRVMQRQRPQVFGIFLRRYADTDKFWLEVIAAENAVEWRKILVCIKVPRTLESLFQQFKADDTVKGVHLRTFRVDGAVKFGAYTQHVPSLLEHFEAQRREVEDMRRVRVKPLVRAEEVSAFADGGNDSREVLGSFRDGFVDDAVTQLTAGIERLTHGKLREQPLFGAGIEVGIINVILPCSTVAQDLNIEELFNIAPNSVERRVRDSRLVTIIIPRTGPFAVYLLFGDLPRTPDRIHQPKVFLVLYYGHGLFYRYIQYFHRLSYQNIPSNKLNVSIGSCSFHSIDSEKSSRYLLIFVFDNLSYKDGLIPHVSI